MTPQTQQLLSRSISTLKEQETKEKIKKETDTTDIVLQPAKTEPEEMREKTCQKKLKLYDNTHSLSHYPQADVNQPPATYQNIPSLVKTIQ